MKISKSIKALLFVLFTSGFSVAQATDHICSTRFIPNSSTTGDHGYLYTTIYDGPNCTGAFVASQYYCSLNATHSVCASSVHYQRSEAQLMGDYQAFRAQAESGNRVVRGTTTCNGGATGCGGYLLLYGN